MLAEFFDREAFTSANCKDWKLLAKNLAVPYCETRLQKSMVSFDRLGILADKRELDEGEYLLPSFVTRYLLFSPIYEPEEFEDKVKVDFTPFRYLKLISGRYGVPSRNKAERVTLKMEHCAFNGRGNQWDLEVKCRIKDSNFTGKWPNGRWANINERYPDAKLEKKHNFVYVTIDSPKENHEFAVFGTPKVNDKKRMQLGLFGEKPVKGKDWKIWAILFDDTMMAFEHVCKMEEGRGRQLLATLAGLFVSNSSEDVMINIGDMEVGWQIKGSKVKTIKSNDAWNSPENSTDFPRCFFEISHVDEKKQLFICEVTASHEKDTVDTDVMAFYEEVEKDQFALPEEIMAFPALNFGEENFTEVQVILQMFVIVVVYVIRSAFSSDAAVADQSPTCDENVD